MPSPPDSLPTETFTEVAHPEFANWSQFGVGTKLTRHKEVISDQGKVVVTTQLRLAEKSEQKVVIESQVTVQRPDEPQEVNPVEATEYPAKFQLPPGLTAEQFQRPSFKAQLRGAEKRTVADTQFDAQLFEWEETNEAGPMSVKVWYSDRFPGRLIRQELHVLEHGVTNVEEVIAVEFK